MTIVKTCFVAAVAALAFSASAATTRVCMGGDVDQLTPAQRLACQQQVRDVNVAAEKFGTPDWHFIVVCDEAGWNDYAAFSTTSATVLRNASADTNAPLHTTFLRGSRLTGAREADVLAATMTDILQQSRPGVEEASLR